MGYRWQEVGIEAQVFPLMQHGQMCCWEFREETRDFIGHGFFKQLIGRSYSGVLETAKSKWIIC